MPGARAVGDLLSASRQVVIPSGALYLPEKDNTYYCSFSAGEFGFLRTLGRIAFWRYDRGVHEWQLDLNRGPEGTAEFGTRRSAPLRAESKTPA